VGFPGLYEALDKSYVRFVGLRTRHSHPTRQGRLHQQITFKEPV